MTKIFIGSDHAGFELKQAIQSSLIMEYSITDCGAHSAENSDYPLFSKVVCENVLNNPGTIGILICSTGIGMSIAANRYRGIRAALCRTVKDVKLARQHNDVNVLVLGAMHTPVDETLHMIQTFVSTQFHAGRHERRVAQVDRII